ncbi:hypothetical protein HYG86_11375 [Alkalicella caledoniensis]|uniref:Uncharacterized protein n=1 Tax=Alkalicella caledoniensis TaxID=2731377 RepID=A0A7G9W9G1_ALKCA|nr:hypothetical protein [Alkalicella caledoniensis]QNO15323.1 hypothetical protein HYG86_11375 [Alkalicella caledoniensis]
MGKPNKETIAINLLTSPSMKEAAEKSGVSVSTIYRLKKQPSFQKILKNVKDDIFHEAMNKAQGYCLDSLETLKNIMLDEEATDSSRVSAARSILELGLTMYEDENIVQRLKELERRLGNV